MIMSSEYFSIWKKRINSNLKKQLDNNAAEKVNRIIDIKCNIKKEGEENWLKACFNTLETELSGQESKELMESCGRSCLMPAMKLQVLDIRKKTENLKEFVETVNRELFGEGHLRIEGNAIYGKHDTCYCPLVQSYSVKYPEFYCNCRQGWLKELYSEVFDKDVHTEVTASILRGDPYCEYKIEY